MKNLKKIFVLALALVMALVCSACGGNSGAYSGYSEAYKKTSSVGSMNVVFELSVDNGEESMQSGGNMKMNSSNEVYYEMVVNGKEILQYVQNGKIHTFIDGTEQISSTDKTDAGPERADPNGGEGQNNEKTGSSSFDMEKFMEEFSGMLEAGKIKEMGVLDPIPSRYIKNITSEKSGNDTVYTMTFPEEFLKKLLNTMAKEQLEGDYLSFDTLKDFSCVSKANSDGYIYFIQYKGYTTVTVTGDLMTSGEDETFNLNIDLQMTIQNPGTPVAVEIP